MIKCIYKIKQRPKTQISVDKVLAIVKFGSNEEVIAETEAYFEAKDKSFYIKGIEMLEKRWNECITLKGEYVDKRSRILPKSC